MLAICVKNSKAQTRFIKAALGGDKHHDQYQLEHASDWLRSDKDSILDQVRRTSMDNGWLQFAQLGLEDEKQVALAALSRVSDLKMSGRKSSSMGLVEHLFSPALRHDRDVMLQFVKKHWQHLDDCSNTLMRSEEFVNTAVSQNTNALIYCLEAVKEDFFSTKDNNVLKELEDGDLWFGSLPKEIKTVPEVLLAALKGGSLDNMRAIGSNRIAALFRMYSLARWLASR